MFVQGHREIVLTGVNLGCFRDREAGYTLARLVREAGAVPGVERLRLSSIEVNHLTDDLVAALRETPAASPHLHVPLQSGDDGVLRAMRRRYTATQYLAKLAPLADFNLTADVIVGFPNEDERGVHADARASSSRLGSRRCTSSRTRRGRARRPQADGRGSAAGEEGAKREAACAVRRALPSQVGGEAWVRPTAFSSIGRDVGTRDDYTPWLLDAEVGSIVEARAVACSEEGILGVAA